MGANWGFGEVLLGPGTVNYFQIHFRKILFGTRAQVQIYRLYEKWGVFGVIDFVC